MSELLNDWESSSMCDQFAKNGIKASTIWDTSKQALLRMKISEEDQIKFLDAKKLHGKNNNTPQYPLLYIVL